MIVNENGYEWVGRFIHRSISVVQKKTNGVWFKIRMAEGNVGTVPEESSRFFPYSLRWW